MPNQNEAEWEEIKTAIKIFKVDAITEHQMFLYVKDLLASQEQSIRKETLEAVLPERSDSSDDAGIGWNSCILEIKYKLKSLYNIEIK